MDLEGSSEPSSDSEDLDNNSELDSLDLEVSSEPSSDSEDLDNNSELGSSMDLEVSSEPNSDSEDLDNNSELDSLDLEVSSEPSSDSEDLDNNSELDSSMDLEVSSEPSSDSEDLDNNSELDSLDLEVSSEPSSDSEDESSLSDMEGNSSIDEEDPVLAERERFRRVMCKTKPVSTWNCDMELMHREHNFINRIGWRGGHTSDQSFGEGYYKSGQVLGQLTLWNTLKPRYAKCLNFNQDGDLLCAGTDDHIVVWNWAKNRTLTNYRPDIEGKIMQIKFIDSAGSLDIVSASSDGQMLRTIVPPSGGAPMSSHCLYRHIGCVGDFETVPRSRHEILSAGDYGVVKLFDLRVSSAATTAVQCVETREGEDLYTIAHHPFAPEFCVGGDDVKLNVYDKRKMTRAVHEITPRNLKDSNSDNKPDITSAVYNHSGSELLACYRRTGNYLFDSRNYTDGDFLHYYGKHFREINFFGPRSEYIVSGDFNGIYFWDKNTGEIICENMDEKAKAVICLKPHPWKPMLATAALKKPGIHIWIPNGP